MKKLIIALSIFAACSSASAKKYSYVFDDNDGQAALVKPAEIGIMMDSFPFAEVGKKFTATVTYYGKDHKFEGCDDVEFTAADGYKFSMCKGKAAEKIYKELRRHTVRVTAETADGQRFDLEIKPLREAKKFDWD